MDMIQLWRKQLTLDRKPILATEQADVRGLKLWYHSRSHGSQRAMEDLALPLWSIAGAQDVMLDEVVFIYPIRRVLFAADRQLFTPAARSFNSDRQLNGVVFNEGLPRSPVRGQ